MKTKPLKMKTKKFLLITISVGIVLFSFVITIFVWNFYHHPISESISDWGATGDFFGGLLNTLISLLSLIVLGYITILISKSSTEESRKLYLLQRRIETYDELAKMLPIINTSGRRMRGIIDLMKHELNEAPENKQTIVKEMLHTLRGELDDIAKYHFFLFNFKARFSHLFEYDFDSEKYKELVKSSRFLSEVLDKMYNGFIGKDTFKGDFQQPIEQHLDLLVEFINTIRDELH